MKVRAGLLFYLLLPGASWAASAVDYYAYGNTLLSQGKALESLPYYQAAVRLDPSLWQAWQGLGMAQETTGSVEPALGSYEKALSLNPGNTKLEAHVRGLRTQASAGQHQDPHPGRFRLLLLPVADGAFGFPGLGQRVRRALSENLADLLPKNCDVVMDKDTGASQAVLKVVIEKADLSRGPGLSSPLGGLEPAVAIHGTVILKLDLNDSVNSSEATSLRVQGDALTRVLASAPAFKKHDDLVEEAADEASEDAAKKIAKAFGVRFKAKKKEKD